MKKFLLIILLAPTLVFSQNKGDYYLQYNYGIVLDIYNPDMDINPYSPDMQSNFEDREDATNGTQFSFGYYISDKVTLGVNYMESEIAGANAIEFYNSEFSEKNVFLNYDVIEINKINAFATAAYGEVEWSADRSLMFDDGIIPLNTYKGTAKKYAYGAGLSYKLNNDIEISLSITKNEIQHDGFDGWDYGSGSDQYLYKSIGVRIYLEDK
jgi:hypothetical protein